MYCKKCGKLLDAGDKFCSNCGTRVAEDFIPAFRREEPQGDAADGTVPGAARRAAEAEIPYRRI